MFNRIAFIVPMILFAGSVFAEELLLDMQRDAMSLNGQWQMVIDHDDEAMWEAGIADGVGPWQETEVPGNLIKTVDGEHKAAQELRKKAKCVWVRRTFELSDEQAKRDVVLKWGGIRFGASAWINSKMVTEYAPTSPHTVMLKRSLLKTGENEILLKAPSWGGVAMSESGYPLMPTGGATQSWGGKGPNIFGDIWLEFYDDIYAKHILAIPDLAEKQATFRIWLDDVTGLTPNNTQIIIIVREAGSSKPIAMTVQPVIVKGMRKEWMDVVCKFEGDINLWTPQTPDLYETHVQVVAEGKVFDDVTFTFGMREFSKTDGHFALNGKRVWLRGSNLVHEWGWGDAYNQRVKEYLIDTARLMNLNCFRTHTEPPTTLWANCADENGMMILAETPLLYNHADFEFTPDELAIFHENAKKDLQGWMTKLWNHPSVIMWVISNESVFDNEWESTELYRHAKKYDPTRMCMRTGEPMTGTPDMVDTHTCFNVMRDAEGQVILDMADLMSRKDPNRPLCNTEYMNRMWDPSAKWLGKAKHPDWPRGEAELNMEHTEAMRRLGFDCLLPYMYARWTGFRGNHWREDYPTPMAASLHSSMAPVLASLDMFDRNYVAGEVVNLPVVLINELHEDVDAKVEFYLTSQDPMFVPDEDALKTALWWESKAIKFAADSKRTIRVNVPVPSDEGTYYVAAVVRRDSDQPVVSQRVLRSFQPDKYAAELKGKRVALFGGQPETIEFLDRIGCVVSMDIREGRINADVVLIDDAYSIESVERVAATTAIRQFAESGGRVVVLEQEIWKWQRLVNLEIGLPEFEHRDPLFGSRAHRYEGAEHEILDDLPADWLWRWNGLPGEIITRTYLDGEDLEGCDKLLWGSNPKYPAVISVPMGEGEILMSQLRIRGRLSRNSDRYDPAAVRVMVNLLR